MSLFEICGQSLVCRLNGETVSLTPWGESSLRVRARILEEPADTRYALLDPTPCADTEISLSEDNASIRCGKLTARAEYIAFPGRIRLTFLNQKGKVLLRETSHCGSQFRQTRAFSAQPGGGYSLSVSFEAQENEHIYGMGQYQEDGIDWKGCTLELAQRNSQASVPFYISSLGYGFLWHNPAVGQVMFGKNRTVWEAKLCEQMDYYITAGDTPAEISLSYAKATGFAPMMPEYGLGFWQCKLRYWNQEQLLNVAREFRKRKLPIDVIVCDFFHWPATGDFRFDPDFFPDPAAMVKELQEMGIELMVSVWPLITEKSENYEEMAREGLLVRAQHGEQLAMRFDGGGTFFDATNPRARDYVWAKVKKNYYDQGIRIFWLDAAEPEYTSYDFPAFRYQAGPALQVTNLYPQLYTRGIYEGMTAEGQENVVNLVRCAWAGSQRYGALVWSGDISSTWEDFRRQLCIGLSMGVSGIPWWTSDIGGFHNGWIADPAFRELLIRWFQWGAYCPVMRLHGDRKPIEPVYRPDGTRAADSGTDNEIWSFGEETEQILRKYMLRREEMRPYIRALMQETHETGKPVMRPLWYADPADENAADIRDEYLFGDRYLVAPVLAPGAREREVYFPGNSAWRDVETGKIYEGSTRHTVPAPLDVIPVFERM